MTHSKILVQGINIYAYHGCLKEEGLIGGKYTVDVCIEADLNKAERSDRLEHTVDYVTIHEIVKKEMAIRSKLIEHVAKRILTKLEKKFPDATSIEVKLTKLNPPIPGDVDQVSVILSNK